ncbi:MAG: serine/threonine protein kinase, partial [Myxococcales bacterium]|nr:serine/threonine protein kinase [Myxococcales bacterium]
MSVLRKKLGRFRLVKRIGMGGMAEVFLALDGEREVAIKLLLPAPAHNPDVVSSFIDEANIAAELSHPNIVEVFEFNEIGDDFFMAMEYVDGWDVRHVLARAARLQRTLSVPAAAYIMHEVALALDYVHTHPRGIIHRDVTPHNIFITRTGHVKLSDFGVAKARARLAHTLDGQIKGKLAYIAPEQLQGDPVTARTDVYGAGLVLFELLTGERYNDGLDEPAMLARALNPPRRKPSSLSPAARPLDSIVAAALEPHPTLRTRDAGLLADDLGQIVERAHFDARALAQELETLFSAQALAEEEGATGDYSGRTPQKSAHRTGTRAALADVGAAKARAARGADNTARDAVQRRSTPEADQALLDELVAQTRPEDADPFDEDTEAHTMVRGGGGGGGGGKAEPEDMATPVMAMPALDAPVSARATAPFERVSTNDLGLEAHAAAAIADDDAMTVLRLPPIDDDLSTPAVARSSGELARERGARSAAGELSTADLRGQAQRAVAAVDGETASLEVDAVTYDEDAPTTAIAPVLAPLPALKSSPSLSLGRGEPATSVLARDEARTRVAAGPRAVNVPPTPALAADAREAQAAQEARQERAVAFVPEPSVAVALGADDPAPAAASAAKARAEADASRPDMPSGEPSVPAALREDDDAADFSEPFGRAGSMTMIMLPKRRAPLVYVALVLLVGVAGLVLWLLSGGEPAGRSGSAAAASGVGSASSSGSALSAGSGSSSGSAVSSGSGSSSGSAVSSGSASPGSASAASASAASNADGDASVATAPAADASGVVANAAAGDVAVADASVGATPAADAAPLAASPSADAGATRAVAPVNAASKAPRAMPAAS